MSTLDTLGVTADSLGLSQLVHHHVVGSTMDVAHSLAADGAPAGVLVLADRQDAGRGRGGHAWSSETGAGIWMTLIERPTDRAAVGVLSLRLGLALAEALEPFAAAPITLKWPNDVFVGDGKLAGILVEARWRDAALDWAAIGMGINLRVPADMPNAAALAPHVSRDDVLTALIPRVRDASARRGPLSAAECQAWHDRDRLRGQRIEAPLAGVVTGISSDGALLVVTTPGSAPQRAQTGSVRLAPYGS